MIAIHFFYFEQDVVRRVTTAAERVRAIDIRENADHA